MFLQRRSPRTRPQRVARSVGIGIAVIAMLWLVAIVVTLSAIPEDFSESF